MGLDLYEGVVVAYSAQVVLILLAWWLAYARDELLLGAYLAFGIGVLYALCLAERHGLPHLTKPGRESTVVRAVKYLRRSALLGRVPRQTLLYLVPAWLVVGPLLADFIAPDIGWLALALLAGVLLLLSVRRLPFFAFERLTVYALAAASVFLVETSPGLIEAFGLVLRGFFVLVVVLIALWLRFGGRRAFRFTAMDFLIIAMMIVLPNIPGVKETGLGVMVVETLVLFYASEIIVTDHPRGWDLLRYGMIVALVIIAIRGIAAV